MHQSRSRPSTALLGIGRPCHTAAPTSSTTCGISTPLPRLLLALVIINAPILSGCTAPRAAPSPAPSPSADLEPARAHPPTAAVSLEGWQAETFPLPPGFAPDLPTGTEELRFAPGWRDPAAEGFWSYAFVMWIDEPAPDAARIKDLLEKYYNGLMAAFAAGKPKDISATPARVAVSPTALNRYEARMHLIDAFATFEPIDLRVLVATVAESSTRSILSIQVSPQPPSHPIWLSLDAAISSIRSRAAAPHAQPDEAAPPPTAAPR